MGRARNAMMVAGLIVFLVLALGGCGGREEAPGDLGPVAPQEEEEAVVVDDRKPEPPPDEPAVEEGLRLALSQLVRAAEGGVLTVSDEADSILAGVEIRIPAGALDEDEEIRISEVIDALRPPPEDHVSFGYAMRLDWRCTEARHIRRARCQGERVSGV